MELRVYDAALNFLGIVEDFDSLIWERNYFEAGNFEITIPASENNMSLLAVGNYISKRGNPVKLTVKPGLSRKPTTPRTDYPSVLCGAAVFCRRCSADALYAAHTPITELMKPRCTP